MFCFTQMRNYWILCLYFTFCHGRMIRVTGIKCLMRDETFVKFSKCFTKPISGAITETTINVTLLQEVKTSAIKLQFLKKSNGKYNPYFHSDVLIDGCKFMANRAISPLVNYIFSAIEEFSNLNHTCPFKDYVLVDRFRIDMRKFKWIPIPSGNYLINSQWYANGRQRFEFGVYYTFTE